jgi:adenylate cyclase
MSGLITIRVFKNQDHRANIDWDANVAILELGRMKSTDEKRYELTIDGDEARLAFADFRDTRYSRGHARITRVGPSKIEIKNTSGSAVPIELGASSAIGRDQSTEKVLPVTIRIGDFELRFERSLNSLSHKTQFHRQFEPNDGQTPITQIGSDSVADKESQVSTLIDQLSTANSILQQATTVEDLYSSALAAIKSLIDMDAIAIINPLDAKDIVSLGTIKPSLSAIGEVYESRQVRWSSIEQDIDTIDSQVGLENFIGAPIVVPSDDTEKVTAILYAHRGIINKASRHTPRQPLTQLHAQIFELIACSVAAGLVRLQHHATKDRFEQFFTPTLARELMKSNDLLEPCERDVTILFCDIRGFSKISERVGPSETSLWVQDVMTELSDCVIDTEGVLVDYIGDELMAMWGAPKDQPDHATNACKCALQMMERLFHINEKWQDRIGSETSVGIGINTGLANVGNTGSKYKFKYGPLGDTVNRASRIQGVTKYLGVTTIMSDATFASLNADCCTRRLGKAKVVNIDASIELFELVSNERQIESESIALYEKALDDLEKGNLKQAAATLKSSLNFDAPDHPSLLMTNEIIHRMINGVAKGEFEWTFDKK